MILHSSPMYLGTYLNIVGSNPHALKLSVVQDFAKENRTRPWVPRQERSTNHSGFTGSSLA